jgi:hypothetical protein
MGYPMTLSRVLNRNGLADGDYGTTPARWHAAFASVYDGSTGDPMDWYRKLAAQYGRHCERQNSSVQLLAGDLRRLERDTVDEQAICQHVARRTGADADLVAAVLKAYLEF